MRKVIWTGVLVVLGMSLAAGAVSAQTPGQAPQDRRQARVERMQQVRQRTRARVQQRLEARIAKIDRNQDHVVSRDEWAGAPRRFDRLDRNRDGALTSDELLRGAVARRLAARRAMRRNK